MTGPAASERLRPHFGLAVAEGLAERDRRRPAGRPRFGGGANPADPAQQAVGPGEGARLCAARTFDHPLYRDLRRQGLLLSDFLDQQLGALRTAQPDAVASGLALDLLAFHTTPLGTAEQRTLAELRAAYAHQAMTLPALLAACRDLYLLVDAGREPAQRDETEKTSRLAHDTLAPLVRRRFEESDAPGQRARRILESRETNGGDAPQVDPLGDADLAIVEGGQTGMRTWREPEVKLIDLSRAARDRRRKRDRLVRSVLVGLMIMIGVTAGFALWQWGTAQSEASNARSAQATAQAEATRADQKAAEALEAQSDAETEAQNARLAQAEASAKPALPGRANWPRSRAPNLAAIGTNQLSCWPSKRGALQQRRSAGCWKHLLQSIAHLRTLVAAASYSMATQGRSMRRRGAQMSRRSSPAATTAPPASGMQPAARSWSRFKATQGRSMQATWSRDESKVLTSSDDGTARIWDAASGEELVTLQGHTGLSGKRRGAQDESKVLTSGDDGTARIWDAASGEELVTLQATQGRSMRRRGARMSRRSSPAATTAPPASGMQPAARAGHASRPHRVGLCRRRGAQDESKVLTSSGDGTARIWDAASGEELVTLKATQQGLAGDVERGRVEGPHQRRRRHRPHLGCSQRRGAASRSRANRAGSFRRRGARMSRRSSPAATTAPPASGMLPAATSSSRSKATQGLSGRRRGAG